MKIRSKETGMTVQVLADEGNDGKIVAGGPEVMSAAAVAKGKKMRLRK